LSQTDFDITLVDPKDYFELNFISPRAIVDPPTAKNMLVQKYSSIKTIGKFIQARIDELTDTHALLSNGEKVEFDYAVIATGSRYADSAFKGTVTSAEERLKEMAELHDKVMNSKSIVIAGGHYVGVEMAAEIADLPSPPPTTIVQSHCALMDASPPKTQLYVKNFMEKKNIKVLLDHRLDLEDGVYKQNGAPLEPQPDLVFWAIGFKVNSDFVGKGLGEDVLEKNGAVKVDLTLRVNGHPKIFCVGDASNLDEYKLAYLSMQHGFLVAKNLKALKKNPEAKLTEWKLYGGLPMFYLTLGKKKGIMVVNKKTHTTLVPTAVMGMIAKGKMTEGKLGL